jgi:tetratricopeptide (TPR) repeat protein
LTWGHTFMRATRAQIAGDTNRAEQLATEALQIGTDGGQPDAATVFGIQLMAINIQRGTMGELVPLIEQMATQMPELSPVSLSGVLAMAHVEGDRTEDARNLLEKFAAIEFDLPLDQAWLTGMVVYAEVAIACRDPKYAGPLFDRLEPWSDQWSIGGGITAEGPVSHYLGGLAAVLGRYDEADDYFRQAAALSDRMGAKYFASSTNLLYGKMLIERNDPGDHGRARDLLTKAQTAAASHGYGSIERRAAAALLNLD